jgi:hypothetical protein
MDEGVFHSQQRHQSIIRFEVPSQFEGFGLAKCSVPKGEAKENLCGTPSLMIFWEFRIRNGRGKQEAEGAKPKIVKGKEATGRQFGHFYATMDKAKRLHPPKR